jgi:hypothetical protein
MNIGDIIRVLEVPANVPAETTPRHVPEPAPATPATQPAHPGAARSGEPRIEPARTHRSASWAR